MVMIGVQVTITRREFWPPSVGVFWMPRRTWRGIQNSLLKEFNPEFVFDGENLS
ncbi:MAG: hypothetical protein BWY63_02949 [Chloroflexi bacterium ADurb.Bin360]|nr:MAG: hypothetical protein BWY63_02949 [Chloroflexi bacterium ADurb.Bin360]